jgi:hypothetical protein
MNKTIFEGWLNISDFIDFIDFEHIFTISY